MRIRGSTQILAATITGTELASNAIATSHITDANVTTGKLAANAVTPAKADLTQTWTFSGAGKITGLPTPTGATDAASKGYADSIAAGARPHEAVRVATAAALPAYTRSTNTITASGNGALTVDGVAVVASDRVLLKNGAAGADNGIYTVTNAGSAGAAYVLDRAADMDTDSETKGGAYCFVNEGTANADRAFVLTTNDPITLNTTALTFSDFATVAGVTVGTGLTKSGNQISITAGGVSGTELNSSVAGAGLNGGGGAALSVDEKDETPGGAVNGSNTAFTIAATPLSTGIRLFLNGILQQPGGVHYTLSGTSITMVAAPSTGDYLRAVYLGA